MKGSERKPTEVKRRQSKQTKGRAGATMHLGGVLLYGFYAWGVEVCVPLERVPLVPEVGTWIRAGKTSQISYNCTTTGKVTRDLTCSLIYMNVLVSVISFPTLSCAYCAQVLNPSFRTALKQSLNTETISLH